VPALAGPLAELRERLRDPLPLLREYVYHPDFGGSFSLKSVAPALAPEIRYGGVAGGLASVLLAKLLIEGRPDDLFEREQIRDSLRSYCALDVLATQRVVERLRELASASITQGSNPEGNVTDCIFCRIASGAIPATKVAETERVLAFRDANPQAPTHVLLIPKEHVADSAATVDATHAELLAELFALAARVAAAEGLTGGWRLVTNVGRGAGQSVFHFHVHLLGGRPLGWPPG
jgi:histidine triad (HIT) family protein